MSCHGGAKPKAKYSLETKELAFKDPEIIAAGKPDESVFLELCELGEDDDDVMPPVKEGLLNKAQQKLLRQWIKEGAKWPASAKLERKQKKQEAEDKTWAQKAFKGTRGDSRSEAAPKAAPKVPILY